MKRIRRTLGLTVAMALLGSAALAWMIESDLSDHREAIAVVEPYWSCARLPSTEVLARAYARAVLRRQNYNWRASHWALGYAVYTAYFDRRISRDELTWSFLRTPALRERGCTPIVRR